MYDKRHEHKAKYEQSADDAVLSMVMWNGFCLDSAWPDFKFRVEEWVALEKSKMVALGQIVYGVCHPAFQSWYLQGIGPLAPSYPARWKVGLDDGIYLAWRTTLHLPYDTSHPVLGSILSSTG